MQFTGGGKDTRTAFSKNSHFFPLNNTHTHVHNHHLFLQLINVVLIGRFGRKERHFYYPIKIIFIISQSKERKIQGNTEAHQPNYASCSTQI